MSFGIEKSKPNTKKLSYGIPWILVVLWMFLIFNLSAQPAHQSNKLSVGVTEKIVEAVEMVSPNTSLTAEDLNHIVRKNAHFSAYLALAILLLIALNKHRNLQLRKKVAIALAVCVLYAISDETHQMFVPGRGPQVKDVFIDSAGAIVGICFYYAGGKLFRKK